jgi:hypothetical protein
MSEDTIEQMKNAMNSAGIDNATIEKIMDKFVVKDKNTVLRTHFDDVIKITALMVIKNDLERKKLKESAKTLGVFIDRFIENMVSKDGNSWKYIFDAISARERANNNNGVVNKLLGVDDKKK